MSAKGLKHREQRLLLVAACLIGAWVLVTWVVKPLWSSGGGMTGEIESKHDKLEALRSILSDAGYIEKEYEALETYQPGAGGEISRRDFLDAIENLSRQSQLKLSLKPRDTRRAEETGIFEVEFEVEGGQDQIMEFLDSFVTMPDLISIERLRIAHANVRESTLRAGVVVRRQMLN